MIFLPNLYKNVIDLIRKVNYLVDYLRIKSYSFLVCSRLVFLHSILSIVISCIKYVIYDT